MAKIIGNTTATPNPQSDWSQQDPTKADYIKNKPDFTGQGRAVQVEGQEILSALSREALNFISGPNILIEGSSSGILISANITPGEPTDLREEIGYATDDESANTLYGRILSLENQIGIKIDFGVADGTLFGAVNYIITNVGLPTDEVGADTLYGQVASINERLGAPATDTVASTGVYAYIESMLVDYAPLVSITLEGGAPILIENKNITIPLADYITANQRGVVMSGTGENQIKFNEGIGEVNSLNVNKLTQSDGDILSLYGGTSEVADI